MKNTKYHQSESYIFSRQAYTSLEQQISTPGLVYAVQRTATIPPAGRLYTLPLAVEKLDTSREPARQPAHLAGEWHDQPRPQHPGLIWQQGSRVNTARTHIRPVQRGLEQGIPSPVSSGTNISRPNTQAHTQTSGYPYTGEELPYPENTQASERYPERPRRGVWQDKYAPKRVRIASLQAVTPEPDARTRGVDTKSTRAQNHINRQTVQVAGWVKPALKAELETVARSKGLTVSSTIAALLEEAIRQQLHIQHAVLLQTIIEQSISKNMRGIATCLSWFLVRVSIDSGQTRSLVTNILGRQPGMTTDLLGSLVKQSAATARGNITRRTPQLEDVIQSVEKWLLTDEDPKTGERG